MAWRAFLMQISKLMKMHAMMMMTSLEPSELRVIPQLWVECQPWQVPSCRAQLLQLDTSLANLSRWWAWLECLV